MDINTKQLKPGNRSIKPNTYNISSFFHVLGELQIVLHQTEVQTDLSHNAYTVLLLDALDTVIDL